MLAWREFVFPQIIVRTYWNVAVLWLFNVNVKLVGHISNQQLCFRFHYAYMKPKYCENINLCYMDTDSFIYGMWNQNLYEDIKADFQEKFDTLDYKKENRYNLPAVNKKSDRYDEGWLIWNNNVWVCRFKIKSICLFKRGWRWNQSKEEIERYENEYLI